MFQPILSKKYFSHNKIRKLPKINKIFKIQTFEHRPRTTLWINTIPMAFNSLSEKDSNGERIFEIEQKLTKLCQLPEFDDMTSLVPKCNFRSPRSKMNSAIVSAVVDYPIIRDKKKSSSRD